MKLMKLKKKSTGVRDSQKQTNKQKPLFLHKGKKTNRLVEGDTLESHLKVSRDIII